MQNQKSVQIQMQTDRSHRDLGDKDTNAAIAGALFGAYYGMSKICEEKIPNIT